MIICMFIHKKSDFNYIISDILCQGESHGSSLKYSIELFVKETTCFAGCPPDSRAAWVIYRAESQNISTRVMYEASSSRKPVEMDGNIWVFPKIMVPPNHPF